MANAKWQKLGFPKKAQYKDFATDVVVMAHNLGDSHAPVRVSSIGDMIRDLAQQAAPPRVFKGNEKQWQDLCAAVLDLQTRTSERKDGARFISRKVGALGEYRHC